MTYFYSTATTYPDGSSGPRRRRTFRKRYDSEVEYGKLKLIKSEGPNSRRRNHQLTGTNDLERCKKMCDEDYKSSTQCNSFAHCSNGCWMKTKVVNPTLDEVSTSNYKVIDRQCLTYYKIQLYGHLPLIKTEGSAANIGNIKPLTSVQQCKDKCSGSTACNSFAVCMDETHGPTGCWFKTKKLMTLSLNRLTKTKMLWNYV